MKDTDTHKHANNEFCNQCDLIYIWNFETHTINIHKNIHTGHEPFDCSTCTYSFFQSCVLTSHSKIHIERKPSFCPECRFIFTIRVNFGKHMKDTHTSQKTFCNQRDKTFFTCWNFETYTINIHKKIHTGDEPFNCSTCTYFFS